MIYSAITEFYIGIGAVKFENKVVFGVLGPSWDVNNTGRHVESMIEDGVRQIKIYFVKL